MLRDHYSNDHPAMQGIDIRGVFESSQSSLSSSFDSPQSSEHIVHVNTWRHPGTVALSLPSLLVEVNARKTKKWIVPATIVKC